MTYEEASTRLTAIIASPDTAQAELPAFLDSMKTDYEGFHTASVKTAEQEERIKTLQDTNMRLFLMQTGKVTPDEPKEELTGAQAMDAFVSEIMSSKGKEGEK